MTTFTTITLGCGGDAVALEVWTTAPLDARWWTWRETEWRETTVGLVEFIGPQHRVMPIPLRFPDALDGKHLVALEDGRLAALTPHSMFPIVEDSDATDGAAAFYADFIARHTAQLRLL